MRFDIFTLFPEVFHPYIDVSIIGRARKLGALEVHLHNIRDWATDKHRTVDDEPYGGGGGMVMKAEPVFAAVVNVANESRVIVSHERLCQAELVENCPTEIFETEEKPKQKTDRDGGFGSTGVS